MRRCPSCQRAISRPSERRCPYCGSDLSDVPAASPDAAPVPSGGSAPAAGEARRIAPRPPIGSGPPWERRHEIGLVAALVDTTRGVMMTPRDFFASMPVRGGVGGPLLYGLIAGSLGLWLMIVGMVLAGSFIELVAPSPSALGSRPGSTPVEMLGVLAFYTVAIPPGVVGILFFEAGLTHLILHLLGGAREGFEATLRVSCYARGTTLVLAVPCAGMLAGAVWLVVARIVGLREAHGCTTGKAAGAVLTPPLACTCCTLGAYVAIFGLAALFVLGALATGAK